MNETTLPNCPLCHEKAIRYRHPKRAAYCSNDQCLLSREGVSEEYWLAICKIKDNLEEVWVAEYPLPWHGRGTYTPAVWAHKPNDNKMSWVPAQIQSEKNENTTNHSLVRPVDRNVCESERQENISSTDPVCGNSGDLVKSGVSKNINLKGTQWVKKCNECGEFLFAAEKFRDLAWCENKSCKHYGLLVNLALERRI